MFLLLIHLERVTCSPASYIRQRAKQEERDVDGTQDDVTHDDLALNSIESLQVRTGSFLFKHASMSMMEELFSL